ncbi:hypothetical protein AHAS_Ahas09G0120700 [Arachis hypogaea]
MHVYFIMKYLTCVAMEKSLLPQVNAPKKLLKIFLDPSEGTISGNTFVVTIMFFLSLRAVIGGFHLDQGMRPRFLQLYLNNTEHEL